MKKLDDKGNISIILVFVIIGLIGFVALVIDIGIVYIEKAKLANGIDSAVLAAAIDLPLDKDKAEAVAKEYLEKNKVNLDEVNIIIDDDSKSIEIVADKGVEHFFARVIGIDDSEIRFSAKALIGPVKSVSGGVRPFAVEKFDYCYGDLVTLKEGGGDGYHGNYGAIALGGTGANAFRNNALYGYEGTITIGDSIDTEPGNMASVIKYISDYINSDTYTFDNFEGDSHRLWTIPLIDSLEVDGRKEVIVIGFAQFFVEDVVKKSGKAEINGRFIQYVTNGEIDFNIEDTGTYGVKLVK